MGRFRDALAKVADTSADASMSEPPTSERDRKALMRHALGLAHYLNKAKKSGQFSTKKGKA
jgi:hypothetical protein